MLFSSLFSVALLSLSVLAVGQEKRQATDAAQFTVAADQLISQYIPASALAALESAVSSAASAAQVTGDPKSLVYNALLAISRPTWFDSAVPTAWATQFAALESNINALRAKPTSPGGGLVPVVIAITTTNSAGSTYTTSVTTAAPSATGAVLVPVAVPVTTTNSAGSTFTTTVTTSAISTAGSGSGNGTAIGTHASSVISALTTQVIGGVTSVFSVAVSGASSVAGGASSVVSSATSKAGAAAAMQTGVTGAAAGVIGLVGMMMAL